MFKISWIPRATRFDGYLTSAENSESEPVESRLAKASHALGPVGVLYDELYFQYCQRLASFACIVARPVAALSRCRRDG